MLTLKILNEGRNFPKDGSLMPFINFLEKNNYYLDYGFDIDLFQKATYFVKHYFISILTENYLLSLTDATIINEIILHLRALRGEEEIKTNIFRNLDGKDRINFIFVFVNYNKLSYFLKNMPKDSFVLINYLKQLGPNRKKFLTYVRSPIGQLHGPPNPYIGYAMEDKDKHYENIRQLIKYGTQLNLEYHPEYKPRDFIKSILFFNNIHIFLTNLSGEFEMNINDMHNVFALTRKLAIGHPLTPLDTKIQIFQKVYNNTNIIKEQKLFIKVLMIINLDTLYAHCNRNLIDFSHYIFKNYSNVKFVYENNEYYHFYKQELMLHAFIAAKRNNATQLIPYKNHLEKLNDEFEGDFTEIELEKLMTSFSLGIFGGERGEVPLSELSVARIEYMKTHPFFSNPNNQSDISDCFEMFIGPLSSDMVSEIDKIGFIETRKLYGYIFYIMNIDHLSMYIIIFREKIGKKIYDHNLFILILENLLNLALNTELLKNTYNYYKIENINSPSFNLVLKGLKLHEEFNLEKFVLTGNNFRKEFINYHYNRDKNIESVLILMLNVFRLIPGNNEKIMGISSNKNNFNYYILYIMNSNGEKEKTFQSLILKNIYNHNLLLELIINAKKLIAGKKS